MTYVEPKGEIVAVSQEGDVSHVCVRFDRMDLGPIAPAGLYVDPKTGNERFQLHKLARNDGELFYFETYNSTHPLPMPGEVYSYRGWWLAEAMEAALDTKAEWVREKYPDNNDHEHCLFTWETITANSEISEGYRSKYGWITVNAYEKFIREDIYRLRRK
ncbi:MAG: hypothetical protein E8D46_06355 [Nitrospira sp.]|nr:hypothetical protein [Nitrospira sp.]TKB74655.1 MAG: hypothetical protein E8D46_06355 [Nitrospira sp.]